MPKKEIQNADIPLKRLVDQYEDFLTATQTARIASQRDRDYFDGKQWTTEEAKKLEDRGQAAIVVNRMAPRANSLLGTERQMRTDPKAYPRTRKHEKGAQAVTDALRYVADNTDFDQVASDDFEEVVIEGYSGALIEVVKRADGRLDIVVNHQNFDRIYYDPHSRRRDYKDSNFKGIVVWLDADDAKARYKDSAEWIQSNVGAYDGDDDVTHADRPAWLDRERKRIKICQHFFKHEGVWHYAHFTEGHFFIEPTQSTYYDEFGEPECELELDCAYVDRENARYGVLRNLIDIQDEINHRRSKLLYLLSVRQTKGEKGAVDDVDEMKTQMSLADGHVEINPGMEFDVLQTGDMAMGQFQVMNEAKAEMELVGLGSSLDDSRRSSESGRKAQLNDQKSLLELGPVLDGHRHWKRRIYRQIWHRIKQFWKEEQWLRVTDDDRNLRWVGLNIPINGAEQRIAELADIEPQDVQEKFPQEYQQLIQQQPQLQEQVATVNDVAELDVDIILGEGQDMATLQAEQFEEVSRLAQAYGPEYVPFEMVLELSSLRDKDKVIDKLKGDEQAQAQQQQQMQQQKQLQEKLAEKQMQKDDMTFQADIEEKRSKTAKNQAETRQKDVETQLLVLDPQPARAIT
jgi:hypothetical protein